MNRSWCDYQRRGQYRDRMATAGCFSDCRFIDMIKITEVMIMETKNITREEALRRFRSTRERKEKRLEEMKEILYKRYVNRTGEEPKYFFAL